MQCRALVVVELVFVVGDHKVDLGPLREVRRLVENKATIVNPGLQRVHGASVAAVEQAGNRRRAAGIVGAVAYEARDPSGRPLARCAAGMAARPPRLERGTCRFEA